MGFFGGPARAVGEQQSSIMEQESLPELSQRRDKTLIAQDLTILGALHGNGVVEVEGTVEGEIRLAGAVTIAPTGLVRGPVEADVVRVAGRVEGSIIASDHLRLEKTGNIQGDVTTTSFVIEDGGVLNGRTTMTSAGHSSGSRPVTAAEASGWAADPEELGL